MTGTARFRRHLAAPLALLLLGACTTQNVPVRQSTGGLGPAMVIERFLRAANSNDLDTMGDLFGTRDGPIVERDTRQEVDDRMFVLASLLRHSDYRIDGEQIVPGRRDEATQLTVELTTTQGPVKVPFILVQSKQGWLVEQIDIEKITHRRS